MDLSSLGIDVKLKERKKERKKDSLVTYPAAAHGTITPT
jgi:hypothetical protein